MWKWMSYCECAVVSWWHAAFVLACISPATTEVFAPSMRYSDVKYTTDEVSTVTFVGLAAVMHVAHGYVADMCGIVTLSIGGLVLYVTSSLVIGLGLEFKLGPGLKLEVDDDVGFVCMRVIQGIGASACTVASLACVRAHLDATIDVPTMYTARAFVLVVAPALSEFVCSFTNDWHAAFVLMTTGGSICIVVVVLGSRSHVYIYSHLSRVLKFTHDRLSGVCTRPRRRKLKMTEWRRVRSMHFDSEVEPHSAVMRVRSQVDDDATSFEARDVDTDVHPSTLVQTSDFTTMTTTNTPNTTNTTTTTESGMHSHSALFVTFSVWIVVDALGFGAMFVWIAYAPQLEDVEYFGYMYSLTFVGSVVGSVVAQHVGSTRHVHSFVVATWVQMSVAMISYLVQLAQTSSFFEMLVATTDDDVHSFSSALTLSTFVLMTVSNGARAVAASHATACAMKASSVLPPGRASALLHSVRMGITCSMLLVALASISPWLVIVNALAGALLIIHFALS